MVWLTAFSVLGLTVCGLLGAAISLVDLGEGAHALAATITATTTTSPTLMPALAAAQPTFHEFYNVHPTEGDVEEPVVTF
jgi:hypothetical protein